MYRAHSGAYLLPVGGGKMTYYHRLTLRSDDSPRLIDRIIASQATTIDEAWGERCRIQREYHINQIVALSTHQTPEADA